MAEKEEDPETEMTRPRDRLVGGRQSQSERPRVRVPPRTCCLAVMLTVVGVACLVSGLVALSVGHDGALPLFLLACLTLVPGVYAVTHVIAVIRGWPGYADGGGILEDVELV